MIYTKKSIFGSLRMDHHQQYLHGHFVLDLEFNVPC